MAPSTTLVRAASPGTSTSTGDGYGVDRETREACASWGNESWATRPGDCDEEDPSFNPGVEDADCDGLDENCDGVPDEAAPLFVFYADVDGDTYGDPAVSVELCGPVTGVVDNDLDCDDTDAMINPEIKDFCDGVDNDCSGEADDDAVIEATAGGVNYGSLEDALGVLHLHPVTVCPGDVVLTESFVVQSSYQRPLRSSLGPEVTSLSVKDGGTVVEALSGSITLQGFAFVEGRDNMAPVHVVNADATIENCRFHDNTSSGMVVQPSVRTPEIVIRDSSFERNIVTAPPYNPDNDPYGVSGAGLRVVGRVDLTVEDTDFVGNELRLGDVVGTYDGSGAGMFLLDESRLSNVDLAGCVFEGNSSSDAPGAFIWGAQSVEVADSDFVRNDTSDRGGRGALYVNHWEPNATTTAISGSTFSENGGPDAYIHGLHIQYSAFPGTVFENPGALSLTDTFIAKNGGGGLVVTSGVGIVELELDNVQIEENEDYGLRTRNISVAGKNGTSISDNERGMYSESDSNTLTLEGMSIRDSYDGAGLTVDGGTQSLRAVEITGNSHPGGSGGGMVIFQGATAILDSDCKVCKLCRGGWWSNCQTQFTPRVQLRRLGRFDNRQQSA